MPSPSDDVCSMHARTRVIIAGRPVCPQCLADRNELKRARARALEQKRAAQSLVGRVRATGVPPMYANADLAQLARPAAEVRAAAHVFHGAQQFCKKFDTLRLARTGFLFTGAPGTGKSHLACAMINALVAYGYSARYRSLPALTQHVRATYKGGRETTQSIIADLAGCDFLVLDEIDLHGASDTDYQLLYEIVNARYTRGNAPTLAISNQPTRFLAKDLGERVLSRIMGAHREIAFTWPSYRNKHVVALQEASA